MTRHTNAAKAHYKATDPNLYITVPVAAKLLGCSRPTVYAKIARGEIKGEHIAGRLVVVRASLTK